MSSLFIFGVAIGSLMPNPAKSFSSNLETEISMSKDAAEVDGIKSTDINNPKKAMKIKYNPAMMKYVVTCNLVTEFVITTRCTVWSQKNEMRLTVAGDEVL